MKKLLVLLLSLTFLAASCDLSDPFSFGAGSRGVYKSEDSAETFRAVNKLAKRRGDLSNSTVNVLSFDPRNTDILYMGSSDGVYSSKDGGDSWNYLLAGIAVGDIQVDPFNSNIVYASGISGNNGKVIKSYDGGTTWVDIYSEASKGNTVITLAVLRSNPKVLVAGLNTGELIRSSDEGHTWQLVKDIQDRIIEVRFGSNNTLYILALHNGLYRSTDWGNNVTQTTGVLTTTGLFGKNNNSVSVSTFYDIALDQKQSGVLYLGTEQGVVRTIDDGINWGFINLPVKDSQLKVSAVAVNPTNSNNIFVSIGSTMLKSLNGGVTWETKKLPTSQSVKTILINPQTPNVIYLGMGERK